MNADSQEAGLSPLLKEALDRVVLLRSGAANMADVEEVRSWRLRSRDHEAAFREAVSLYSGLRNMLALRNDAGSRKRLVAGRRAFLVGGGAAMAASVAGAWLVVKPPLGLWPSYAEISADYRTGIGESRTIQPAEGVNIDMNTRTSLRKLPGGQRIAMVEGEAFAGIDRQSAFGIRVGEYDVTATRADFNLRSFEGQTCVTCIDGQLSVEREGQRTWLHKGQQIVWSRSHFGKVEAAAGLQATDWRQGTLVFNDAPLNEVLVEINRYRKGRIMLKDNRLGSRLVSAVFHTDQMARVPLQLEQYLNVRSTWLPGDVVLIG